MSLIVEKLTASAVVLDDLGITITGAIGAQTDLTIEQANDIAQSSSGGDLEAAINGTAPFTVAELVVVDPRSGYSGNLNAANSLIALRAANDVHIGVQLANLGDLDNVTGNPVGDEVLQYNNVSGNYELVTPSVLAGTMILDDLSDVIDGTAHTLNSIYVFKGDGTDLSVVSFSADADVIEAVQDIIGATFSNGTDTTFVYNDAGGSMQVNVNDVFLRNTGDTLDSGTLTIASGATIAVASGGSLTIVDAPTNPTDAVNKAYVDSVAAGLDPKESVRYGSIIDVSGTYLSTGGTGGTGAFTSVDFTSSAIFDGLTAGAIVVGNRILVKEQTEAAGFADAAISGSPAGTTVTALTAGTYDFDVTIDGGGLQQLSITTAGGETYAALAALMNAQVTGGTVAFVSGAFRVSSASLGTSSTVIVAAGTAGSGGGDVFGAIDTADTVTTTFPVPVAGSASTENGIYVVTTAGATGAMERATDQDGSPASEVSAGNFTFIEQGTTLTGTGWVVTGDGILTLNSDPIDWTQFSESSVFSAGDGLALTGNVFSLDLNNLTAATITTADEIGFNDVSATNSPRNTTVANFLTDLNIPNNITTNGIIVNNAGTYSTVLIAADGAGALDGLVVANADGTAGNPTIGLDIQNLPVRSDAIDLTDRVAVYNITTSANEYYTVSDLANAGAANAFGSIIGDTGTATADSPSDSVTFTGDGVTITGTAGASAAVDFALNISDLTTIGAGTIALTDEFAIDDTTTTNKRATFADLVADLQIPNAIGAGVGFVVSDGAGNYVTRSLSASTNEDQLGINVTPTDGSANTTVGLDIVGLTNPVEDMAATDEFPLHNKSEGTGGANRKMTGQEIADGVATILSLPSGLAVTAIGGQQVLTLIDTTRANKVLSIETTAVTWSENRIGNNDWVQVGNANDALVGFIVPLNATIVKITGHTTSGNNTNIKNIDLYVDDVVKTAAILSFPSGGGQQEDSDVTLNVDIVAGEKLQLRGASTGGNIQDTVITVWLKWRG